MKIDGGGWVVGLSASTAEKGLLYVRTDVSGAYRWEPGSAAWKQLVTASSLPPEAVGYGKYAGVDSLVGAPNDPDVAYMVFGSHPYGLTDGAGSSLWHSTDGGETCKQAPGIDAANNIGLGRGKNADYPTLYVAGAARGCTGIFRSTDRGQTWDQIADYPLGIFDHIDAMDGDKDTFGQIYVCFSGSGFAYGKPATTGE